MTKMFLAVSAGALLAAIPVKAQDDAGEGTAFPAALAGQAVLPADTMVAAPEDAPDHLRQAGKFSTPDRRRTIELGAVPGMDGVRPTGAGLPLEGQSVQGFSGIRTMNDGTFWTLSDNGFGNRANSSDAMLMLHRLAIDFETGSVDRQETIFLSDPERIAPFPIVMEGSDTRYLTGADFDLESIQPVEDGFWIGEEFGPYLLHFDGDGQLSSVHSTMVGETEIRSPDHPALALPATPVADMPAFNLKRSGGFEGLALSVDGTTLYGMLEGPVYRDGEVERTEDGRVALRIVEFDVAERDWTGRSWLYPLADGGEAIGDFNMLDETTALVIERDSGAGRPAQACNAEPAPDCFARPAELKRVYKIAFDGENAGGTVRKIGYVDLMDIADPHALARQGSIDGRYDMPFVTIENVDRVDETHIIVANDNNYPFSAGRELDRADDTEFVLLEVSDLLSAE